jgi:hypothetical protein
VHLAQQRQLLQVELVDGLVGELLTWLKRSGPTTELIVIATDDGISFGLGREDRRRVNLGNVQDVAPVPLFVTLLGQRWGRVSRVYPRTSDIAPTITESSASASPGARSDAHSPRALSGAAWDPDAVPAPAPY